MSFKIPDIQVLQRLFLQRISGDVQKTGSESHDAENTLPCSLASPVICAPPGESDPYEMILSFTSDQLCSVD